MDKEFLAPTNWNPERPKTLVICCSDGCWHAQVEDFLESRAAKRADMCVLPGGPASFSLWGAGFDESHQCPGKIDTHNSINSALLLFVSRDEVHQNKDQRDHQENVNQAANGGAGNYAQQPKDNKDNRDF